MNSDKLFEAVGLQNQRNSAKRLLEKAQNASMIRISFSYKDSNGELEDLVCLEFSTGVGFSLEQFSLAYKSLNSSILEYKTKLERELAERYGVEQTD